MRTLAVTILLVLAWAGTASAHALDQYIQSSLVSVGKDRVQVSMRLVPGVAVLPVVLAAMDADRDGAISPAESTTYAHRVLADIKLSLDGQLLAPQLVAVAIPPPASLPDGLGEIHIDFMAGLPSGGGNRKLVIENHHLNRISAYLVNSLVSSDPDIRLQSQHRNADQSVYALEYGQSAGGAMAGDASGFGQMFRMGVAHIAEGTDHLLFLLALLLPTPLLARAARWVGPTTIRSSVLHIAGVVTAFTLGHSITLALAGLGIVNVPGRPIEILIAVSILVSAVHALRPLFPGREAFIAAFFGLIHGLAFATVLGRLGLDPWQRAINLLGFNLGIEAMQLIVVAATLPSLLLLSRTRAYGLLRIGGALFAGIAALCWVVERVCRVQTPVDMVVNALAQRAPLVAAALFMISLGCWALRRSPAECAA